MKKDITTPLIAAVNALVSLPTAETFLCEGKMVSFDELKEILGDRLDLTNKGLITSHVRRLAASIKKHGEVMVPILLVRVGDKYRVKDGHHRLAAVKLIRDSDPDLRINVLATL